MSKKTHSLNYKNTCRDTALDLINYTLGIVDIKTYLSRLFFINLKVSDFFSRGKPNHYFYVFPPPPSAYQTDSFKYKQLCIIYRRMEDLIKKAPFDESTIQKFKALTYLYKIQAGTPEKEFNKTLENIQKWKIENNQIISILRKQSLFGKLFNKKASTISMVEKLEQICESKVEKGVVPTQIK